MLCGKYIQDNKYKILSNSSWLGRQCDKSIWCGVGFAVPIAVHLQSSRVRFNVPLDTV